MDMSMASGQCLKEVQIPLCSDGSLPGPPVETVDCWLPIGVELLTRASECEGQQASLEDLRWLFGRLERQIDTRFEDLFKRLSHKGSVWDNPYRHLEFGGAADLMKDRPIPLSTLGADIDKENPCGPRSIPTPSPHTLNAAEAKPIRGLSGLGEHAQMVSEHVQRILTRAKAIAPTLSDERQEERTVKDSTTLRGGLCRLLQSTWFEAVMCVLILMNVCAFGFEVEARASHRESKEPAYFEALEFMFGLSFLTELAMRVYAYGLRLFFLGSKRWWNITDSFLVLTSLPELVVDLIFRRDQEFRYLGILREARTLRIVRVVRILKFFRPLRILMDSVGNTLRDLGWMLLLVLIIMYNFGVLFTFAASAPRVDQLPDDVREKLLQYFGSLYGSVLSLFKATTGGFDWSDAGDALDAVHPLWGVLFLVYIVFCNLAVFNVVTGIVCHTAIETAQRDRDSMIQSKANDKARYTKQLEDLFTSFDADHSGKLTLTEFEEKLHVDGGLKQYFDAMELSVYQALDLFKLLDIHNTGEIETDDFVAGCLKLRGEAKSIDMHMLMYQSKWTMNKITSLTRVINALVERTHADSHLSSHGREGTQPKSHHR